MKKILSIVILLIVLVLGGIAIYIKTDYEKALDAPNSENAELVNFEVLPGESINSITENLVSAGLLKAEYKNYFLFYVKANELYPQFQAGNFTIPQDLTIQEITTTLQTAGLPELWVTIPEGLRKDEIAEKLATEFAKYPEATFSKDEFLALTNDSEFIATLGLNIPNNSELEGFIYPDRYLFPSDMTTQDVLTYMVDNFKNRVGTDYTYEDVIMASLLEREGRSSEERRMIADILYRRLNEGWYLGLCATVSYVFQDWQHEITYADLQHESPYNTYNHLGLPPTPICSPGIATIEDAKNPTPNDYYFFLHEDNGTIHYARTQGEHEANQAQYLSN